MPSTMEQAVETYGLEAVPDSVRHLTQLLANKNASAQEIAQIIASDEALTNQILRAANPSAANSREYTITSVEQALNRAGTGWALVLAISEPLTRAVNNTFKTILGLDLEQTPLAYMNPLPGEHIVCEISFSGQIVGSVSERLSVPLARELGLQLLGGKPPESESDAALCDALAELSNMIGGNFRSNLCDAGLCCILTVPNVSFASDALVKTASFTAVQRFGFRSGGTQLFADLTINPWGD